MILHYFAVGMVVSGLMIHVYMGAVFPEEKPAFYSMITGAVNELYAYHHHFKWWREVKVQEQQWRDKLRAEEERESIEETAESPVSRGSSEEAQ
jgi:cytochrome b subunit of formate dehydrogenase